MKMKSNKSLPHRVVTDIPPAITHVLLSNPNESSSSHNTNASLDTGNKTSINGKS